METKNRGLIRFSSRREKGGSDGLGGLGAKLDTEESYLTFRMGQEVYAVPVAVVMRIQRFRDISVLPLVNEGPNWCVGYVGVEKYRIPVVDLGKIWGIPLIDSDKRERRSVIFVRVEGGVVGVLVEVCLSVARKMRSEVKWDPIPDSFFQEGCREFEGISIWDGGLVVLVGMDRLLTPSMRQDVDFGGTS